MGITINRLDLCPTPFTPLGEECGDILGVPSPSLAPSAALRSIWPEYIPGSLLVDILKEDPSFAIHLNWDRVLVPNGSSFTSLTARLIKDGLLPLDILFRTHGLVKKIYFEGGVLDLLRSLVRADPSLFAQIPQRYRVELYRTAGMRRAIAGAPGNLAVLQKDRDFITAGRYFNVIAEAARANPGLFANTPGNGIFTLLDLKGDGVLSFADLHDEEGTIDDKDLIDIYRAMCGTGFDLLTQLYTSSPLDEQALFAHLWESAKFTSLVIANDAGFLEDSPNPFYILKAVAKTDPDHFLTRLVPDLERLQLEAEGTYLQLLNIACFGAQAGGEMTLYPPCFGNPDLLFDNLSRDPERFGRLSFYDQRLFYRLERGKEILKKNPSLIGALAKMSDRIYGETYWEIAAGMLASDPLLFTINDPAFITSVLDRNKDGNIDIKDFSAPDLKARPSDILQIYNKVASSNSPELAGAMNAVVLEMWRDEDFNRFVRENLPAMYAARHDEETIKTVPPTLEGMRCLIANKTPLSAGERWKAVLGFLKNDPAAAKKKGRRFIETLLDTDGDKKVTIGDLRNAQAPLSNAQFKELSLLLMACGYSLVKELLRRETDWGTFNSLWKEKDFVAFVLKHDAGTLKRLDLPLHILFGIAVTDAASLFRDFRRQLLELRSSSPRDYRELLRMTAQECPFHNVDQASLYATYLVDDLLRPDGTGLDNALIKTLSSAVRQTAGARSDLYAELLKDIPEDPMDPLYARFWGTRFLVEEAVRLHPAKKEAFIKRHEDEINSRFLLKDITYRYDDLIYPERLGHSTLLLYKVLESRKRPNRSRKTALVIQAKTDWNGAFEDTNELLFRLYLDHEVIYHVVDDKGKIKGLLDDATRVAPNGGNANGENGGTGKKRLAGLVFSGHGRAERIELNGAAGDEHGYLTAADVKGLELERYLDGSAFVLLDSCNAAKEASGANMAQGVAEAIFEGARVYAAPYPVSEASIRYNRFGSPYSDVEIYFFSTDELRYIRAKEFSGNRHFLDSILLTADLPVTLKSP